MLCFADVETSDLDPQTGDLLEVAFVLCDDDLVELASIEVVINPLFPDWQRNLDGDEPWDRWVRHLHPEIQAMHAKNGLFTDVLDRGVSYFDAEVRLGARLDEQACEYNFTLAETPLCGNSVWFDRNWLVEKMPSLPCRLTRQIVDVSTLNQLAKRWMPEVHARRPRDEKVHRALPDARYSLSCLRHYRREGVFGTS